MADNSHDKLTHDDQPAHDGKTAHSEWPIHDVTAHNEPDLDTTAKHEVDELPFRGWPSEEVQKGLEASDKACRMWFTQWRFQEQYKSLPVGSVVAVHITGAVIPFTSYVEASVSLNDRYDRGGHAPCSYCVIRIGDDPPYEYMTAAQQAAFVPMRLNLDELVDAVDGTMGSRGLATFIGCSVRDCATTRWSSTWPSVKVDDGADVCVILPTDLSGRSIHLPSRKMRTVGAKRHFRMTTMHITIDGLTTLAECAVRNDEGNRLIGLNVIHRYVHTIDYRLPNPRHWRARSDLLILAAQSDFERNL